MSSSQRHSSAPCVTVCCGCVGDDIAATICPRIAYNVDGDCDIFDHQKVAYCERMQLGMDAYGFTACMHTNMLLRARALQEVGWFPTHTKSENWELGMLLVRHYSLLAVCIMFSVPAMSRVV